MVEVFALKWETAISEKIYSKLLNAVDEGKRRQIERYSRSEDAERKLWSDLVIRFLASQKA